MIKTHIVANIPIKKPSLATIKLFVRVRMSAISCLVEIEKGSVVIITGDWWCWTRGATLVLIYVKFVSISEYSVSIRVISSSRIRMDLSMLE